MRTGWLAEDAFAELLRVKTALTQGDPLNEATTRLRIIDTILFDVLRWDKAAVETERYSRDVGYADYVFDSSRTKALVLEAKKHDTRDPRTFTLNGGPFPDRPVPFSLLASESPAAAAAMRQAASYAPTHGSRFVAISNGPQWVISLAFVPGEAIENRLVFVFESIAAIETRFRTFFRCFSPTGVLTNSVLGELSTAQKGPPPAKLSASIAGYPVPAGRSGERNQLRSAIQLVWDEINQDDDDPEFLERCYVPPRQDDNSLELARELIEQRRNTDESLPPEVVPADRVSGVITARIPERPILVIGRVGHGKSIFLRYLRRVGAAQQLAKYLQIDVNFVDRPDKVDQVADYIYNQIDEQLRERYQIDPYEDRFARGVLNLELRRFRETVEGKAAAADGPDALRRAESKYLTEQIARSHDYFAKVFRHLRGGRGYSVAIFLDNLDRRQDALQEEAALRASAMARDWECLVFVCLRPGTIQRSGVAGVLDSIAPKHIVITSPPPSVMLRRRFEYAEVKARGELPLREHARAGLSAELSRDLPDVATFFASCAESVYKNARLAALLHGASNGNNRALLLYVRQVVTSGHLNTRKMLEIIREEGRYTISEHEVARALLFADCLHYDPNQCRFINLFDIEQSDPIEHFLLLATLEYINRFLEGSPNGGYVDIDEAVAHVCSLGFSDHQARGAIRRLYEAEYLEGRNFDAPWDQIGAGVRVRERGRYHITRLINTFVYLDAVVIDTPITDDSVRRAVRDVIRINDRLARARGFLRYLQKCASAILSADFARVWDKIHAHIASDITDIEARVAEVER